MYIYLNVCKQMTDIELLLLLSNTQIHLNVGKQMTDIKLLYSNFQIHLNVCTS